MMIKRALVYGLLFMFLVPAPLVAGVGPKISFTVPGHDFGDVIHGESPSVDLICTNEGDAELIIERLESSCGCAKAVKGSRKIAPGSSSRIHAQIDTLGMRPGRHSKTIDVYSNDPERSRISLRLNFNVIRNVSIEPRTLGLSLSERGKDAVFTLTAANYGTEPLTVKGAKSNSSDDVAVIPQDLVVPAGSKAAFRLVVKVHPRNGQAYARGTALIETTDTREETIPIRYLIRLPQVSGR